MIVYGFQWFLMVSIVSNGFEWFSMVVNGVQGFSIVSYDFDGFL